MGRKSFTLNLGETLIFVATVRVVGLVVFSVKWDLSKMLIFFVANLQQKWTKREARRLMGDPSI